MPDGRSSWWYNNDWLIASPYNDAARNLFMKKIYSSVYLLFVALSLVAQTKGVIYPVLAKNQLKPPGHLRLRPMASGCDTLNYPLPASWTITYYVAGTNGSDGFVTGSNAYGDQEKAAYFNASSLPDSYLTKVWIGFAKANSNRSENLTKTVSFNVYDGTFDEPGDLLATTTKTISQIQTDVTGNTYTEIIFSGGVLLPDSKKFFVSVDITNLTWSQADGFDSLAIYSNQQNQTAAGANGFGWEKNDDNWAMLGQSWGADLALVILPFLGTNPNCSIDVEQNSNSTDYFRTVSSGNWNSIATWESSADGFQWHGATLTPDSSAHSIIIQNGHIVTVTANLTVDDIIVNAGGTLQVNSNVMITVIASAGGGLTLNGNLLLQPGGTLIVNK
jgi:hypothetical protein